MRDWSRIGWRFGLFPFLIFLDAAIFLSAVIGARDIQTLLNETGEHLALVTEVRTAWVDLETVSYRILVRSGFRYLSADWDSHFGRLEQAVTTLVETEPTKRYRPGPIEDDARRNLLGLMDLVRLHSESFKKNLWIISDDEARATVPDLPLVEVAQVLQELPSLGPANIEIVLAAKAAKENLDFIMAEASPAMAVITGRIQEALSRRSQISLARLNISVSLFVLSLVLLIFLILFRSVRNARTVQQKLETEVKYRTNENVSMRELLFEREKMAALGRLVAGIAHEVNTPLGIGVTASWYMRDTLTQSEKTSGGLSDGEIGDLRISAELILSNLRKAADLVRGFKRIAVDESDPHPRTFELASYLADDLLPSLGPYLSRRGHSVEVDSPEPYTVNVDPGDVAQIVTNLVMNASLHGYGNRRGAVIRIRLHRGENEWGFDVADEGEGMHDDTRRRIFEPFFTTDRSGGGSGLGLMVVYNTVTTKMGGRVECRSVVGKGTVFEVRFSES